MPSRGKPFYDLLVENGVVPDLGAALAMDDLGQGWRVRRSQSATA